MICWVTGLLPLQPSQWCSPDSLHCTHKCWEEYSWSWLGSGVCLPSGGTNTILPTGLLTRLLGLLTGLLTLLTGLLIAWLPGVVVFTALLSTADTGTGRLPIVRTGWSVTDIFLYLLGSNAGFLACFLILLLGEGLILLFDVGTNKGGTDGWDFFALTPVPPPCPPPPQIWVALFLPQFGQTLQGVFSPLPCHSTAFLLF